MPARFASLLATSIALSVAAPASAEPLAEGSRETLALGHPTEAPEGQGGPEDLARRAHEEGAEPLTGVARRRRRPDVRWDPDWPRVRWWEYALAPALLISSLTLLTVGPEPAPDFGSGNRFDRRLQDGLSVRSQRYRSVMHTVGTAGYIGPMAYRAFEDLVVVGLAHGSWRVAGQLVAIDALTFGLVGFVVGGSQLLVGRERPITHYCLTDPAYADRFGGCERYIAARSFISGHVAVSVAGASLTCLHHQRLPIYREAGGRAACGASIAAAAATAVARSTGDLHWPTDVLLGAGLGFVAGWIVPRALHFGFAPSPTDEAGETGDARPAGFSASVSPIIGRNEGGLQVAGAF